jgi:hypothetical protein
MVLPLLCCSVTCTTVAGWLSFGEHADSSIQLSAQRVLDEVVERGARVEGRVSAREEKAERIVITLDYVEKTWQIVASR